LSGRGLCDELITRPEESYRLCCVVVCNLETSRIGAPYIYDISNLRVKIIEERRNSIIQYIYYTRSLRFSWRINILFYCSFKASQFLVGLGIIITEACGPGNHHYWGLWAWESSLLRLHDHTQTNHTRWDSSGRIISPTQRHLQYNREHSRETDNHALGAILTCNSDPHYQKSCGCRPIP